MNVSGDEAKAYDAVSLSDYSCVNRGELVSADDATGVVVWRDTPESTKTVTLGDHRIRIVRRGAVSEFDMPPASAGFPARGFV